MGAMKDVQFQRSVTALKTDDWADLSDRVLTVSSRSLVCRLCSVVCGDFSGCKEYSYLAVAIGEAYSLS